MRTEQPLRSEAELEQQLDAYLASAQANSLPGWKQHLKRWSVYAAAGCSTLAFATSAEAGIIYSGIQNVTVTRTGNNTRATKTFHMNVGGKSTASQFRLSVRFSSAKSKKVGKALIGPHDPLVGAAVLAGSSGVLLRFNSGSGIPINPVTKNATSKWGTFGVVKGKRVGKSSLGFSGLWAKSKSYFAGVRFAVKTSQGKTGYDYGWVRLKWEDPKNTGFPTTLIAVDWAYNNVPNQAIVAGAGIPPPVLAPEPSSIALALLAAGAAGLAAWRRRGQAAKPEPHGEGT